MQPSTFTNPTFRHPAISEIYMGESIGPTFWIDSDQTIFLKLALADTQKALERTDHLRWPEALNANSPSVVSIPPLQAIPQAPYGFHSRRLTQADQVHWFELRHFSEFSKRN
jgi:hypothetical protein